jgi:hypothetical protein
MSSLTIVGGVYRELVTWPTWDQIYGSAGRAAVAVKGHVSSVDLRYYAAPQNQAAFDLAAKMYEITCTVIPAAQSLSFEYIHCLSTPKISPPLPRIQQNRPIQVSGSAVLRFGMLEGTAIVDADYCVYDPQSPFAPERFEQNGSKAKHLAVVCNRAEISALTGLDDPLLAAQSLLGAAEVIVIKSGPSGAVVVDGSGHHPVPAYQSDFVWTVGSGDVFAAIFAAYWAVHKLAPLDAATLASKAVASYAGTMSLPIPSKSELNSQVLPPIKAKQSKIYLASPFFTISQRWLVEEARAHLFEMGASVFSPLHDIGPGPAGTVAPADLVALKDCDCVFAVVDGLDSGTLFEIGYARALEKPVYALAQTTGEEDLKMVTGSGCKIFSDYVTAIYHTAWQS